MANAVLKWSMHDSERDNNGLPSIKSISDSGQTQAYVKKRPSFRPLASDRSLVSPFQTASNFRFTAHVERSKELPGLSCCLKQVTHAGGKEMDFIDHRVLVKFVFVTSSLYLNFLLVALLWNRWRIDSDVNQTESFNLKPKRPESYDGKETH